MFSNCLCICNEGNFGIFRTEGDLQCLRFRIGGCLLISYSPFLPDFQEESEPHIFLLEKLIQIPYKPPKCMK